MSLYSVQSTTLSTHPAVPVPDSADGRDCGRARCPTASIPPPLQLPPPPSSSATHMTGTTPAVALWRIAQERSKSSVANTVPADVPKMYETASGKPNDMKLVSA